MVKRPRNDEDFAPSSSGSPTPQFASCVSAKVRETVLSERAAPINLVENRLLSQFCGGDTAVEVDLNKAILEKTPMVIRAKPTIVDRDNRIGTIEESLFSDLTDYLSESASEYIHVQSSEKDEDGNHMMTRRVTDPDVALGYYRKSRHSLYCRAPPEIEDRVVRNILGELRLGPPPRCKSSDRFARGEIETFFTRAGHTTPFHTDFQENFTIMISGEKEWAFDDSPLAYPQRGTTPHFNKYSGRDVAEAQIKQGLSGVGEDYLANIGRDRTKAVITLQRGDVLYHPAGVWHEVRCTKDSIALNVSLTCASNASILTSCLEQLLWSEPAWRAPYKAGITQEMIHSLHNTVNKLTAGALNASGGAQGRGPLRAVRGINSEGVVDDDDDEEEEEEEEQEQEEEEEEEQEEEENHDGDDDGDDYGDEDGGGLAQMDTSEEVCTENAAMFSDAPLTTDPTTRLTLNPCSEWMTSADVKTLRCTGARYLPSSMSVNTAKEGEGECEGGRGFAVIVHSGFGNESLESLSRRTFWVEEEMAGAWHALSRDMAYAKRNAMHGPPRLAQIMKYDPRLLRALFNCGAIVQDEGDGRNLHWV